MPTRQEWLEEGIYLSRWTRPVNIDDLRLSFQTITRVIGEQPPPVHLIFDLVDSGALPSNTPYVALKSGFMTHANIGKVLVIGNNVRAQMLADMVMKVTQREIIFFDTYKEAMAFLQADAENSTEPENP